jgi:HEXXH motif-containing protein
VSLAQHLDRGLTSRSGFAESAPLLAKVDATFSLAAEVAAGGRPDAGGYPLRDAPLADDTVLRRALELFLHLMRSGDPRSGEAAELLARTDLAVPPGPRSDRPDPRFAPVRAPGGRTVRVLTRLDPADEWTSRFLDIFRAGLTEPDSRYAVVPAEDGEVATIRAAVDLLERLLPGTAASVLSHLALVGVVAGPGAFESASDRKVPRAIFVNRAALGDVPRTAEAVLHECVHQKLYDIQLVHQVYRAGYDAERAAVVRPPWHDNAAWSYDRALAAAHVYVHLAAFYTALECGTEPEARAVDAAGGRRRTVERARFLLDAVAGLSAESGPAGLRFVAWLRDQLDRIEAGSTAAARPQPQGVR